MTAKSRRHPGAPHPEREPPDVRDIFRLHVEASQRRNQLLEEVRALRAAGRIREASIAMRQADQIQECLAALEMEVRLRHPHSGTD